MNLKNIGIAALVAGALSLSSCGSNRFSFEHSSSKGTAYFISGSGEVTYCTDYSGTSSSQVDAHNRNVSIAFREQFPKKIIWERDYSGPFGHCDVFEVR